MTSRRPRSPQLDQASSPGGFWSALGRLDLAIGILLGAMLLPLILGPLFLVYELIKAGAHAQALFVGSLFALCTGVVVRAVRRGEFGPGTVVLVLGVLAAIVLVAIWVGR